MNETINLKAYKEAKELHEIVSIFNPNDPIPSVRDYYAMVIEHQQEIQEESKKTEH